MLDTTLPENSTKVWPWEDCAGEPVRHFEGTAGGTISTPSGEIDVRVQGIETLRGIERTVVVNDVELPLDDALRVRDAIDAAIDEVKR